MRIALPGGQSVTCIFAAQEAGSDTLDGTVEGSNSPVDRCDLVVTDGAITGDIQLETGRYRIVPTEGGSHAVIELKQGAYPNEGDIPLPPLANGAQRKSNRSPLDAPRCDTPPRRSRAIRLRATRRRRKRRPANQSRSSWRSSSSMAPSARTAATTRSRPARRHAPVRLCRGRPDGDRRT